MISKRSMLRMSASTIFLPHMQGGGGPDLAALLAAAKASAEKRLYLPAGDYALPAGLLLDVAGLEVVGDGIGKTRLICDGLTISGLVHLLTLNADRVTVRDLSIVITNTSGTGQLKAIACDWNCTRPTLKRVEVQGGYGTNNAGGAAFDFYRTADRCKQYATVEDCTAWGAALGTGFIVNSNANTFTRCEARDSGTLVGQHGFYVQGGYNTFRDCRVMRVKGYSYNATCNVSNQDGSANVFDGCISIDPGGQHLNSDGYTYLGDGSHPDVPAGAPLGRGVMISNCTFRRSANGPACNGVFAGKNATVQGCYFEDAIGVDLGTWLQLRDGSTAIGNVFVGTNYIPITLQQGIVAYRECTIIGNHISGLRRALGIKPLDRTLISGNVINLPDPQTNSGVNVQGAGATIRDNRIAVGGGVTISGTPMLAENNY